MKIISSILIISALSATALGEEKCPGSQPKRENIYKQQLADQAFGIAFSPDDFFTSMLTPFSVFRDYYRPWRQMAALTKDLGSTIKTDKDQFQVNLDVQHFAPDEITVKTAEGYVVIEAKHEEKKDEHGYISRQFVRKYSLPEGTEPDSVVSQLSSDGVLTVSAMRKAVAGKERVVPITQTGPVKMEHKEEETCDSDTCVATEK